MADQHDSTGNEPHAAGGSTATAPSIDFTTLVLSIREVALLALHMKDADDPEQLPPAPDYEAARTQIDMIDMLRDKTKGNLTPDEQRLVDSILYELRLAFIQARERRG